MWGSRVLCRRMREWPGAAGAGAGAVALAVPLAAACDMAALATEVAAQSQERMVQQLSRPQYQALPAAQASRSTHHEREGPGVEGAPGGVVQLVGLGPGLDLRGGGTEVRLQAVT
jgi:hypothetical protein